LRGAIFTRISFACVGVVREILKSGVEEPPSTGSRVKMMRKHKKKSRVNPLGAGIAPIAPFEGNGERLGLFGTAFARNGISISGGEYPVYLVG
jgi:hypothetical protein